MAALESGLRPPGHHLSRTDLLVLWGELAGGGPPPQRLIDDPETAVPFLRQRLEPEPSFTIRGTSIYAELDPAVFRPFADAWREIGLPQ